MPFQTRFERCLVAGQVRSIVAGPGGPVDGVAGPGGPVDTLAFVLVREAAVLHPMHDHCLPTYPSPVTGNVPPQVDHIRFILCLTRFKYRLFDDGILFRLLFGTVASDGSTKLGRGHRW